MIDIHCHILPRIDDGPRSIDESLDMCRIAAEDGIQTIVATPHFKKSVYEPDSTEVFEAVKSLQEEVDSEGIGLRLLPGADFAVTSSFLDDIKRIEHLTINRSKRYFLAELPHSSAPPNWDDHLLSALDDGIVPILTHPERNPSFVKRPESVTRFVHAGGLVQITSGSITGEFGDEVLRTSAYLLSHGLVHVIATDAHSATYRAPLLSRAVAMASDLLGDEAATALVTTIPAAIIEGKPLSSLRDPVSPSR